MSVYDHRRRQLAQHVANTIIRLQLQDDPYYRGKFNGLQLAAALQGFSTTQVSSIIQQARDWSAANCPGHHAKLMPHCVPDCAVECSHIPLDPRSWRDA